MSIEQTPTPRSFGAIDELLHTAGNGSPEAFDELYLLTSARVFALVRRVLVDSAQSEEVTQDVFVEVWQLARRYDPRAGGALSWMLTIAHRRAIDRVRASQASRARDLRIGIRDWDATSDDVADTVETSVEHDRAARALGALTPIQRQAVSLAYWDGLTVREIADRLDVRVATAKTRIRDGLLRLRRELEPTH